jgi:hypothetical protein
MTNLRLPAILATTLFAASAHAASYLGSDLATQSTFFLQRPQVVGSSLFLGPGFMFGRPTVMDLTLPPLPQGVSKVRLRAQLTRHNCALLYGCSSLTDEDFFIGLRSSPRAVMASLGDQDAGTGLLAGADLHDTGLNNIVLTVSDRVGTVRPPVGGSHIVEMTYTLSASGTRLDMAAGGGSNSFTSATVLAPDNLHLVFVRDSDRGEQYQIDWVEVSPLGGETHVAVDIKPGSCPNPLNAGAAHGVVAVAVSGNADVAVDDIDAASVRLAGVAPLRWHRDDVATPYAPFTGKQDRLDCVAAGGDGQPDLVLHFDKNALVAALGGHALADGATVVVPLTGTLHSGSAIAGEDVMWVRNKARAQGKGNGKARGH